MKALDRIISFIFSVIMLEVAVVLILVGTRAIDSQMIIDTLSEKVFNPEVISSRIFNPITIGGIVLFLASLKTTIFLSLFNNKNKASITVKTKNGEIQIAQDSIISTAKNATMSFDNVKEVQAKMRKKGKGIVIYESIQVYSNINIRELTIAIQEAVKEKINSTTGVIVKDVNINIKNIYNGKKRETLDNNVQEFVPVKLVQDKPSDGVFNVDEAVEKMADVSEPVKEVIEETAKEVVEESTNNPGDTKVSKE